MTNHDNKNKDKIPEKTTTRCAFASNFAAFEISLSIASLNAAEPACDEIDTAFVLEEEDDADDDEAIASDCGCIFFISKKEKQDKKDLTTTGTVGLASSLFSTVGFSAGAAANEDSLFVAIQFF